MSSKFWVCIALVSIIMAHTYVYTEFFSLSESQEVTNFTGYFMAVLPDMRKTKERLKLELRTVLEMGQKMTQMTRKMIVNFREQREREKAKSS